ncbi:HTH_ARSR domain containing protein [uncultured Caudovirales phage]|uniref:HTH_ARSR domain containing protein n=1 Tax=uncultured Caudovirales phage TaxID=2100421 RepID=A0A6J5M454_9CAUD|nr:HTH_ARSR domain containing protein [uncultured Caudovirales phage]
MSALPEVIPFTLPKKPRIKEQEPLPDQRKVAVIPIRACTDPQLTHGMIRALLLICSYANRSGITWVSQHRLAEQMGITQQAISKHLVKLTKAGYLEVMKRPIPGQKHTTWRVIFDPSIKAEDAISLTSSIEDTRPPYMKQEQTMHSQAPDPAGQARIASLIAKALKSPTTKKERTMPKTGETVTTKKMKEEIAQAKAKRSKGTHAQPPEVVCVAQPFEPHGTTSRGCTELREHSIKESIYKDSFKDLKTVLHNSEVDELIAHGLTIEQIADSLDTLLPLYAAEGIKPTSAVLVEGIRQLQADAR